MKKARLFRILTACTMLTSMAAACPGASAQVCVPVSDITAPVSYIMKEPGHWFASCDKGWDVEGEVAIYAETAGFPVTDIEHGCFTNCAEMTALHIPDSVTSISTNGGLVFEGCTALTDIYYTGTQTLSIREA